MHSQLLTNDNYRVDVLKSLCYTEILGYTATFLYLKGIMDIYVAGTYIRLLTAMIKRRMFKTTMMHFDRLTIYFAK